MHCYTHAHLPELVSSTLREGLVACLYYGLSEIYSTYDFPDRWQVPIWTVPWGRDRTLPARKNLPIVMTTCVEIALHG